MPADPGGAGDPLGSDFDTPGGGDFAGASTVGLKGFADFRNSIARHLPTQIRNARRTNAATLRLLGRRPRIGG